MRNAEYTSKRTSGSWLERSRRPYIPKSDGTKRPSEIPAAEDKIVQIGVKRILEMTFETDFVDESHGFGPGDSYYEVLDAVNATIMTKPVNYVADMDIRKFFDTVDH